MIGKKAPFFQGQAFLEGEFMEISLDKYKGKYLVFFFYPLDFTFVCPTEILSFSEALPEFEKINCAVVGCSVDSQYVHMKWCSTPKKEGGLGGIKFPLLSDLNKEASKAYKCLITDGNDRGCALRATFIIDPNGILRFMSYNDLSVGRNIDEILRLVNAVKFTDENGEVCPSKWKKKGDATMKADHKEAQTKKYFQQQSGDK